MLAMKTGFRIVVAGLLGFAALVAVSYASVPRLASADPMLRTRLLRTLRLDYLIINAVFIMRRHWSTESHRYR